jgi:hypothetical protein
MMRAIEAARKAGLPVLATEIAPDGSIRLVHENTVAGTPENSFDAWKARRGSR